MQEAGGWEPRWPGVLGFPSRRGLTPRGSLECNPEIPCRRLRGRVPSSRPFPGARTHWLPASGRVVPTVLSTPTSHLALSHKNFLQPLLLLQGIEGLSSLYPELPPPWSEPLSSLV